MKITSSLSYCSRLSINKKENFSFLFFSSSSLFYHKLIILSFKFIACSRSPFVDDAVTGELSKLLNEIKICRDKDCSFEELCQTISSHSQSMESFGSGRLSDEERNGTLTRINKVCIKKQIQYSRG